MKRRLRTAGVAAAVLAVALYGGWWWLLRSEWLREKLRERAVLEIEKATGGKAELGRLDFDPNLLGATIENFTLHGTEPAGALPLAQVERVTVGLKVISFLTANVDVGRIEITRPRVHVTVDAEGKSNLPSPAQKRPPSARGPVEQILRLAADAFAVHDAEFSYNDTKHRFSASGRNLKAEFDYDVQGPVYRGAVGSDALQIKAGVLPRLPVDTRMELTVHKDAVEFRSLRVASAPSVVTGTGRLEWEPAARGRFALRLKSDLTELHRLFGAEAGRGALETEGTFEWLGGSHVRYDADVRARALDVFIGGVRVTPVAVDGHFVATEENLAVTRIEARAAEGRFRGKAELPDYKGYAVDGEAEGLSLGMVLEKTGTKPIGYSGRISGPVRLSGLWKGGFVAEGEMEVRAEEGGVPLEGRVSAKYEKDARQVSFRDSYLKTAGMRLDFGGVLTQTLQVKLAATNLDDLKPALVFVGGTGELPVRLDGGSALFEGTVSGALREPLIAGQVRALQLRWRDVLLGALSTTVVAAPDRLSLTRFSVTQGGATATGSGTLGLDDWKLTDASSIDLRAEARNLNVGTLRRQAGYAEPVEGLVNANAQLSGTVGDPRGEMTVDWFRPAYGEERLDRIRATLRHGGNTLEVPALEAQRGPARLTASGRYAHRAADWKNGDVEGGFQLEGLDLAAIAQVQSLRDGTSGRVQASAKVKGRVVDGVAELRGVDGEGRLREVVVGGRQYGELAMTAVTRAGGEVDVSMKGSLRGSPIASTSTWRLTEGFPVRGRLGFGVVPFSVLNELRPSYVAAQPWPFQGSFRGNVTFEGPADDLDQWKVDVSIEGLNARPERRQELPGRTTAQDFELKSEGPLRFRADGRTITIQQAKFTGRDTSLSASGTFSLAERRPWDLKVDGSVDLAGVRAFSPDIIASGVATLQATVRGELAKPQVTGVMELREATLSMDDVPNGLDKVTGRVLFDRSRATIENKLTAESGGGALALSGFIDFSGEDTFYRLQADANRVRIRYPEGVSTVADAAVSLSGTTQRSLLAGTVTVLRSGFTPRTDFGSLLAESGRAASTPAEANQFLANMQLDVKVRTSAETQFSTSLTNDLQAEANLQIRGTGARPSALGRIMVSQGDINFFGNKYTIKRGDVSFYNPTKIEPTLDMDLETRVRGVDVTINFTGPIDKLNVSYRSDPPLQPGEIIALLTVGRSPTSATVGSSQSGRRGSFLESGANSLLGSAIAAPISSQLQRFFGVSRIKIDPTISGLEGTPQARVTVEQQVSKDVTVMFVTNLNRSQQQVVRFEWNVSKEWSLIALRDENGSFGVDFQVRKQVK